MSVSIRQQRPDVPKGNPLLGPIRNEREFTRDPGAVIRKSLRPFKQVYWKGRGLDQHHHAALTVPQPACDGVAWFGSCFYYASAAFTRQADGGGMTMTIERPTYVSTGGSGHTLDEIAIQGGPGNGHIVELGWNLSSDQYGDTNPHLFVFHWNNWAPTCYDGCGWQQYSSTYFPGMDLSSIVGRQVYVGYVFFQGNWWAWFDNQWLGYFPGSEWGGSYTRSELIQWFGEVASSNGVPPRTDMGNGRFPSDAAAATNFTLCDVDAAAWVCWYRDLQSIGATVPADYDILRTGFGATRFGGPGE
ncbi:MAG: neprosin family prolyl endopeptidase [Pyrinomonadaceae bacterium]